MGAPRTISVYQDDIFPHAKNIQGLLTAQQEVFDRLTAKNLVGKVSKTKLNYSRFKALGHNITERGRTPDPKHISAILDIATPEVQGDIQSIMGLIIFNADYIPMLAKIAAPISDLGRDGVDIPKEWKDEIHG